MEGIYELFVWDLNQNLDLCPAYTEYVINVA